MDSTKYSNIKLIITSVDGVFTNGSKTYDWDGNVAYKTFLGKDFEALIKLSECFGIVIVSTCGYVSPGVFRKHGFNTYIVKNKKKKIQQIIKAKGLTPHECIYIGSDLNDIPCTRMIPMSFCPKDAFDEIKDSAVTLPVVGGEGVIYNLYKTLKEETFLRYKYCR